MIFKTLNPLVITSLIPLSGILFLFFVSSSNEVLCRKISLWVSCLTFISSLLLWIQFDGGTSFFQFTSTFFWFPYFNFYYSIGLDGLSLFFVLLTTFLVTICILISWSSVHQNLKDYLICFLILEFFLIQVFCVLDIFLFYIYFESVLIPMFLIIGIWGSRERKVRAAYQFFLYTLIGSLLMLLAILVIYFQIGSTDLQILRYSKFSEFKQIILWISFFASFAVKIPMIPFHIWLPEAHAEAPTAGSVILAGILLKLGGYGFLRFSLPMFPWASIFFTPLVFILSLIAIVYASLTTLRQIDLKKIIAYSSVSHMGFVTIGIFSLNIQGLEGSVMLMLSHGIISSALFLSIGVLYDRYKTRLIKYYTGLVQVMPIFSVFFLFFTFSNIGFPGTSSFIGETLVLLGLSQVNMTLTFFSCIGIIIGAAYSIWLFNRINFGSLKLNYINLYQDVSRREFFILLPLSILIIWMGICPSSFLNDLHCSSLSLLESLY
uniref:NADH dehydrogenase subunit 4 n=1 Tax=Mimica arnoldii TaxID=88407 RepID=UPI0027A85619|nr:NADH dehydrogenase subunit 4 [Mimica arnoldii]WGO62525.1 NADH dehydrogenase subunit 4 [Mimica arnoldii]